MTETKTTTGSAARASSARRAHIMVLGCGSAFSGDDQAGLVFIQRLQAGDLCRAEVKPMPQAGIALLDTFSQADILLIVDAVASGDPPGTLHLVPLPSAVIEPRSLRAISGHGWGLKEVLDLAAALGRRIPRLLLLGIEIGTVRQGSDLTPEVVRALELALDRFGRLESILESYASPVWRSPQRFLPGDTAFPARL